MIDLLLLNHRTPYTVHNVDTLKIREVTRFNRSLEIRLHGAYTDRTKFECSMDLILTIIQFTFTY